MQPSGPAAMNPMRPGQTGDKPSDTFSTRRTGERRAIAARLLQVGLRLGRSIGDGNCMARAISESLNSDRGEGHATVRRDLVNYIRTHRANFAEFFPVTDGPTRATDVSLDARLARVERVGAELGDHELRAACLLYNRDVLVHGVNRTRVYPHTDWSHAPIHLAYMVDGARGGHYDVVHYVSGVTQEQWRGTPPEAAPSEARASLPDRAAMLTMRRRAARERMVRQPWERGEPASEAAVVA